MKFLYPEFLFALFALSIPILVHLFNFRRFKRIEFTNVRFLKEIKEETTSRSRLRHLLVLAARLLAIFFLVMAFAQPFIPDKDTPLARTEHAVSIYVDNSFSMEALSREGTLLDDAKRKALEIIDAYNPNDKFQLLTNDFEGRHQRLLTRDEFITLLEEVRISPAFRTADEIISRQAAVFYNLPRTEKTAYLVSDFQKNMVLKDELQADSSLNIRWIPVQASSVANISIDTVYFISPIHRAGEPEELVAKISNNGTEKVENVSLKLLINEEQKSLANLSVEAGETRTDTLRYTPARPGWQEGQVVLTDHPISFDDRYFFSYKIEERIPILLVNEDQVNPYLNAVYKSDPYFRPENTSSSAINYAALSTYRLIILNGLKSISSGLSQELLKYLGSGGSLAVFPASDSDPQSYSDFLGSLNADGLVSLNAIETQVDYINLQHPLFRDVFERTVPNMDLPRVKQHFSLTSRTKTTKEVLMSLKAGGSLLNKYSYRSGKLYLFTVPLNQENTSLPKHFIFVPLMYKMALHSGRDFPLSYYIGTGHALETESVWAGEKNRYRIYKDGFEIIPVVQNTDVNTTLYVSDQVRDAGNYQFAKGEEKLSVFSFNYNRRESDMEFYADDELEKLAEEKNMRVIDPGKRSLRTVIGEVNFGTRLWKVCIILALLFLAVEIVLLRYGNRFFKEKNTGAK